MTTLEAGGCANCNRAIAGTDQKFCPACGQSTPVHRIDWHFLGHELEHSVLHMDRGLFYSLKQLMLRPGRFMRDYIEGRRGNQAKPLLLLMIMSAVVVVLTKYLEGTGVLDSAVAAGIAGAREASAGARVDPALAAKTSRMAADLMNQYFAAFTLLLLPLEAAAFRLAFHRVGNLNYPEWLVITALLTVQCFVFWAVLVALHRWIPQPVAWAVLLSMAYAVFSLVQFFQGYPRWKSVLRTLLGLAIFMVMSAMVSQAVAMLLVISMPA
ncbi:DUF3667 domain-containing protein [Pseudoxanthomonas yeongjuensis]|uniref:DUF3667 domain-containing protein n=1 Tax=Pseudoxanthomonas yeongjuensis TaxID=377616 RepID=UPI00139073A5|nr:DUF3667 domain-containing protein [Pseudoxanthomonas yeongjuensis]